MNNIAWIISELIYRSEIIVDGKEIAQRIISVETLNSLFSQLNTKVTHSHYNLLIFNKG